MEGTLRILSGLIGPQKSSFTIKGSQRGIGEIFKGRSMKVNPEGGQASLTYLYEREGRSICLGINRPVFSQREGRGRKEEANEAPY